MRQKTGRKQEAGDRRQAQEGVKRQETGDMGKTGDRRRETGDNALTSKAGVRKSSFCFFRIKNPSCLHYGQIGLLKVSSERGDLKPFFKNFKCVRSYPYSSLISILEK